MGHTEGYNPSHLWWAGGEWVWGGLERKLMLRVRESSRNEGPDFLLHHTHTHTRTHTRTHHSLSERPNFYVISQFLIIGTNITAARLST